MSNTKFTPEEEIRRIVTGIMEKDGKLCAIRWLRENHGIPLEVAKGYCDKLRKLPDYYPYYNDPALLEALQPFAELAKATIEEYGGQDESIAIFYIHDKDINLKQLRALLTALSKAEGTNKQP